MIPAARESFAAANGRQRLPYDAEVEWLGTTARGPFINTGIRATYKARVKMRFYIGDATATWQAPFGGDQNTDGGTPSPTLNMSIYRNGSGRFGVASGYGKTAEWGAFGTWAVGWYDLDYNIQYSSQWSRIWLNSTFTQTQLPTQGTMRYPILLFTKWRFVSDDPSYDWIKAANTSGAYTKFIGRVAWYQLYESGVLVQDLIPVRKAGVGYMYDRVSASLLGNVGTGSFVYGTDVAGGGGEWLRYLFSRSSARSTRLWKEAA